jgi:hypothetical protein
MHTLNLCYSGTIFSLSILWEFVFEEHTLSYADLESLFLLPPSRAIPNVSSMWRCYPNSWLLSLEHFHHSKRNPLAINSHSPVYSDSLLPERRAERSGPGQSGKKEAELMSSVLPTSKDTKGAVLEPGAELAS